MNEPLKIPTHFRFLNKKEAAHWNRTTDDWNPIHEIQLQVHEIQIQGDADYYEISTPSFAWVTYDVKKPNLEFKVAKFTKKDLKEFNEYDEYD